MLAECTWAEVRETAYEVAVLPWGATEAHNRHLPYATDTIQCDAVAAEAAGRAWARGARVIALPTVPFGVNTTQLDIPLTLNVNPSTQQALLGDLARALVALLRDWSNGTDTKWQAVRRVWQAADTLHRLAANNDANALAIAAAVGFDALLQLARRGRVTVDNKAVVQFAGIPAKRKAALVAGQLLEAAAPRTRFTKYIKADIASYL